MDEICTKLLNELKRRSIFSEYLPENFNIDSEIDIYRINKKLTDNIEPYSYSMSRLNGVKGDRRTISIPSISAYIQVIRYLNDKSSILEDIIDLARKDKFSFSKIVDENENIINSDLFYGLDGFQLNISSDPDVINREKQNNFLDNMYKKIRIAQGAVGILHIDISEFYRNIYTHSLTALKIGVDAAEVAYRSGSTSEDYAKYKVLDEKIRNMNGKRTNGLLIGPYISYVLAESVLANVDQELEGNNIEFTRFADDYEIIIREYDELSSIKNKIHSIFEHYFLKINTAKTYFEEYPVYVFDNYERIIGKNLSSTVISQDETADLFSEFFRLEKRGDKGAIRYLLKRYDNGYSIKDNNLYLSYLLNILMNDEKALGIVCKILIKGYQDGKFEIDQEVYEIIYKKLEEEMYFGHDLEVVWLVYLLKYLGYPMEENRHLFSQLFFQGNDMAVIVLIHEWREMINDRMIKDKWDSTVSWILLYELSLLLENGYEMFCEKLNLNQSRDFYKELYDNGFTFYKC